MEIVEKIKKKFFWEVYMEKLSFTAIYKLLSYELFNKKQVNKEIKKWLNECFHQPFCESKDMELVRIIESFDDPASGNDSANFFNKRLDSSHADFRIRLADYLMKDDGKSLNKENMKRIRTCISNQLINKIEKSRKRGELVEKKNINNNKVIEDIVEELCNYDFGSANSLKEKIHDINKVDSHSAFMILTIVSLFGDKCRAELPDTKSKSTLDAAEKFDKLVRLLSTEDKPSLELIRSNILTLSYNGDEFLFNEEWRHFLNTGGERIGKLANISLATILQYAIALSTEKRKHFNIKNNNDQAIQIALASINTADDHKSDISICLYIMRLYSEIVIGYWHKKDSVNYSHYFKEAKEYRRQVLSIISSLNPCFDMSEEAKQNRKLLENQIEYGIPATVNFLHREAIYYSYTNQIEKSIDTYYNYISALSNYSGAHIDHVRFLISSAENDLAFVMMKSFDLSNAEKYFELSLQHKKQLLEDRERRCSSAYTNLAQINKIINNFEKALNYIEDACSIRKKLLEKGILGPGSLMLSENTYSDIYIRMALCEKGKKRNEFMANAKEKLNTSFLLYEEIENSGSEGALTVSKLSYIKSLILAGVISYIDEDYERSLSFLNKAMLHNNERFTDKTAEMFNLKCIRYSITIRLLLAEVFLKSRNYKDASPILTDLKQELIHYRTDVSTNEERLHFSPTLQWTIFNVLYAIYLIKTGADNNEVNEYINEAGTTVKQLCDTGYSLHDEYRDNNRKAYGKLAKYIERDLPSIKKGEASEKDFYSISFLMLL